MGKKKNKLPQQPAFEMESYMKSKMDFMKKVEFVEDMFDKTLYKLIELSYPREFTMDWYVKDMTYSTNSKKYLITFAKRFKRLTDEEYETQYGSHLRKD